MENNPPCPTCHGKGRLSEQISCNACNGTGTVQQVTEPAVNEPKDVSSPEKDVSTCPTCGGDGLVIKTLGGVRHCFDCGGTGTVQPTVQGGVQGGVQGTVQPKEPETYDLPCLNCGKLKTLPIDSLEARGVFNVFCNGDCEDRYAFKQ